MSQNTAAQQPTDCPAWCTEHVAQPGSHFHVAARTPTVLGDLTMSQSIDGPGRTSDFTPEDEPRIGLGDFLLSLSDAATLSALLTTRVASAMAEARLGRIEEEWAQINLAS
jgi:hypothetical protein